MRRRRGLLGTRSAGPGERSGRRTIVVTGSARGVGAAVRFRLEAQGCRVIGIDLHDAEIETDLGTPQGRVAAMNQVLERSGRIIDGLVLAAGLGPDEAPPARLVSVNYYGAVEVLDGLRPGLAGGTDPAAVAMVSNTVGLTAVRDASLIDALLDMGEATAWRAAESFDSAEAYAMTKIALTRALRMRTLEWGRSGVRLNAVARGPLQPAPSPDAVNQGNVGAGEVLPVPIERGITAEEVAGIVSFLLGADASIVHGAVVFADGGTDALLRPEQF